MLLLASTALCHETSVLSPPRRMPIRFLIADDMPAQQKLLANAVMFLGGESRFASNGREALHLAEKEAFDIILMDLQMPLLGGVSAADHLLRGWKPGTQRARIMAITGENPDEVRPLCRAIGMDGFVSKPYTMTALKASLIQLVTYGHCWREGEATRILDVHQLSQSSSGGGEDSLANAMTEARFTLLTLRTRLHHLPPGESAALADTLAAFARAHGFVEMAPVMAEIARAARNGDTAGLAQRLMEQHDHFEMACKAALAWQNQDRGVRLLAA